MSKSITEFVTIKGSPNELPSNYSGEAIVKFKNGEKFVGLLENGKKKQGKYYYSNKSVYEGFFLKGRKSGIGKLTKQNSEEFYYGNFENGKKKGTGFQKYWNEDFYYGEWKNNKKNGRGIYYFSLTKEYLSGEWIKGYLLSGTWLTSDDFKFEGKFFQNKPKNKGSFIFLNNLEINVNFNQLFNIPDSNTENEENIDVYWYHAS